MSQQEWFGWELCLLWETMITSHLVPYIKGNFGKPGDNPCIIDPINIHFEPSPTTETSKLALIRIQLKTFACTGQASTYFGLADSYARRDCWDTCEKDYR